MPKRFLINCDTSWCGENETFSAIAEDKNELKSVAQEAAWENFNNYPQSGLEGILSELFPDVEDEDYSDEQMEEATEHEEEYYSYYIKEWDETRDEEEWNWYDLIYDCTKVTCDEEQHHQNRNCEIIITDL